MKQAKLRLFSNSSLSDYKDCPRLFYYKYILEWRPEGKAVPLIFGGAWHRAQDQIWAGFAGGLNNTAIISAAYMAFQAEWIEGGLPAPGEFDLNMIREYGARTPMQAHEMIVGYVHRRRPMWEAGDLELVDIEKPFAVPLDPEDDTLFYVGKIDKVVRARTALLRGIEHKTTSAYRKEGSFKASFLDQFHLNSQVDGYLYAMHMIYPGEVEGVWVDAALVHKETEAFKFIPIEKQLVALDQWLGETRSWVRSIEKDIRDAEEVAQSSPYLLPFRRRTENCIRFEGRCPFFDVCRVVPNPKSIGIPLGFVKEPWDPLEHLNRDRLQFVRTEKKDALQSRS